MMRRVTIAGGIFAVVLSVLVDAAGSAAVADAVMKRDKDAVRALLKEGADVNAAQGDGMTALHWAARSGDVDLAQMLLYAGANVKATTRLGAYTPLMMAAEQGHAAVIAALLAAGADVKAANATGTTPLMLAALSGDAKAVTMLVENGAEVDAQRKVDAADGVDVCRRHEPGRCDCRTAQGGRRRQADDEGQQRRQSQRRRTGSVAAASGSAGQPGGNARGQNGPASAAAPPPQGGGGRRGGGGGQAGVDRPYFYNELVGYQGGVTPLLFAARGGYVEAAKLLVDGGADVNQVSAGDKTSPLLIATINGHFDLAKWLLDRGANPNAASGNGVTPLYAALNVTWAPRALYPQPRAFQQQQLTYLDFMKALLDKGATPNLRLTKKVWYSEYNFDLAGVDEIGATPFWRAAFAGDVAAMKLLMDYGADPNIPTMKPAGRPRVGDSGAREVKEVVGPAADSDRRSRRAGAAGGGGRRLRRGLCRQLAHSLAGRVPARPSSS